MPSHQDLVVKNPDTDSELLISSSLRENADIEQITPSVKNVIKEIIISMTITDSYGILIKWPGPLSVS